MIGKIKNLGPTLFAILALSAAAASTAQAGHFEVGAKPAVLTGHRLMDQEHILTLIGKNGTKFNASCTTATVEGTVQEQVFDEVTLTPTFGKSESEPECVLAGQAAQVKVNGCKYTLTGSGQEASKFLLDIVGCTPGKQIEFISATCTLHIGEQNNLAIVIAFTGADAGGTKDIRLGTFIGTLTTNQTGAACPTGNNFTSKSGSFVGDTTLKAFQDNGTTQVTKKDHQYKEHIDGTQVTLVAT